MTIRYVGVRECTTCKELLTNKETYLSGGVCPHCGAVSGGTITNHVMASVPVKIKETKPLPLTLLFWLGAVAVILIVAQVIWALGEY